MDLYERPFEGDGFWDDGDWIRWDDLGEYEEPEQETHLQRLEREAELKLLFPNGDITVAPYFFHLLDLARDYLVETGRHLDVYGQIGELYGVLAHGIRLHRNFAQGSDGRLGDDFVEIKTISPDNAHDRVSVQLHNRNFSKLLLVRIDRDFNVDSRMLDRRALARRKQPRARVSWTDDKTA